MSLASASEPACDWSDAELLQRMMQREPRAWREFHSRYDRLIYRAIHKVTQRFTSVLDSADVELLNRMLRHESLAWREFHTRFDRLIYRAIHKVTQRFSSVLDS
ncbi:MAG TPA: hypothetical protein VJU61_11925, partial [Polyangiaceae bacterium]|nr:hypothetical protein [Polyangiaceae bacterium]